ncbi:hypothetical protein DFAR_950033 [Desulfarculales bacterium]
MEYVRPTHADLEDYFRKRAARRAALDRTINCRVKRGHQLLRLESSSTTAPTGGFLF